MEAIPKNWWSGNYDIRDGETTVATLEFSPFRETMTIRCDGEIWSGRRRGCFSGAFVLENSAGKPIASAQKPSALHRRFLVEAEGRSFVLRAKSLFNRGFELEAEGGVVGSITPPSALSRRAVTDLPDSFSLPVRVFLIGLVLLMWRRAAAAAAT